MKTPKQSSQRVRDTKTKTKTEREGVRGIKEGEGREGGKERERREASTKNSTYTV